MTEPSPPATAAPDVVGSGRAEPTTLTGQASRRGLAVSVLTAVVGGGIGYVATGRTWAVATRQRAAPLGPETIYTTGRELVPWATAAALVGLAGGLALLATKGRVRFAVAALLALSGVGVTAGGLRGLLVGSSGETTFVWPMLCVAGGALVLAAGVVALARSRRWAAMGARYDAPAGRPSAPVTGPDGPPAALWDALDRGDDPTR